MSHLLSVDTGHIVSIQVGQPEKRWDALGKSYTSAIGKFPVTEPIWLGCENLVGDKQANRKYHGGPDKALCVYASEHYPVWRAEFAKPEQAFGSFGENLTTTGLTEDTVCIGDIYQVASGAAFQVCQPRVPCINVRRYWNVPELPSRMEETGWTGFYCRVITEGELSAGEPLRLRDRFCPEWNIARANRALYALSKKAGKKAIGEQEAIIAERRALITLEPFLSSECVAFVQKLGIE